MCRVQKQRSRRRLTGANCVYPARIARQQALSLNVQCCNADGPDASPNGPFSGVTFRPETRGDCDLGKRSGGSINQGRPKIDIAG